MTGTIISVAGITVLALVVVWDFIQSKRIDALQKRVAALEKK